MSDPLADHEFGMKHGGENYVVAIYNVRSDDDGRLLYDVRVRNSNDVVVFSDDFAVVNPPIMVPDGTYRKEISDDGTVMELPNLVEDLVAAFESFTADMVIRNLASLQA